MPATLLTNARIFDGTGAECADGMQVLIEGDEIREVSDRPIRMNGAQLIDIGGRTLMPGLIDAHFHAYFSDIDWHKVDAAGEAYRTAYAVRKLGYVLDCGFTTVRDIGGGDYGLWRAIHDGLVRAPRFFYAGKMLSMTGGHGDTRGMNEREHTQGYCACGHASALAVVADGVDACIKATREELRRGAHCIKVMASGGVSSPADPIWMSQFREDELRAIVNEVSQRRSYVSAHCHPASAARRCIEFGVRVIEHGTLMDGETAKYAAEKGVFVVPTLVIIHVLAECGAQLGLPAECQKKLESIARETLQGLDAMRQARVKVGFGTDLLGATYLQQCREFSLRREVFTPLEILQQATSINASLLQQEGALGCIKAGARADMLAVDGDPLKDINLLACNGRHLSLIMRAGQVVRNEIS